MTTESLLHQAGSYIEKGNPEAAERLYWQVLQGESRNIPASLNLASLLFDRGKVDEAATLCRVVSEQDPELPALHILLSRIAYARQQFESALHHITAAHVAMPDEAHVAAEFQSASRRRYWTLDIDEYPAMFDAASRGELDASLLPRLAHQTLARLVRPRLIELLCGRQGDAKIADDDEPLCDQWARELDENTRGDLLVLVRNFRTALSALHAERAFGPRAAVIRSRDGAVKSTEAWVDVDPLTYGAVELVEPVDGTRFLSPAHISRIQFGKPEEATPVLVTLADGGEMQARMPVFGFFTTFSPDAQVRSGRITVMRQLFEGVRIPLGLKAWETTHGMVPMVNVESIEFIHD